MARERPLPGGSRRGERAAARPCGRRARLLARLAGQVRARRRDDSRRQASPPRWAEPARVCIHALLDGAREHAPPQPGRGGQRRGVPPGRRGAVPALPPPLDPRRGSPRRQGRRRRRGRWRGRATASSAASSASSAPCGPRAVRGGEQVRVLVVGCLPPHHPGEALLLCVRRLDGDRLLVVKGDERGRAGAVVEWHLARRVPPLRPGGVAVVARLDVVVRDETLLVRAADGAARAVLARRLCVLLVGAKPAAAVRGQPEHKLARRDVLEPQLDAPVDVELGRAAGGGAVRVLKERRVVSDEGQPGAVVVVRHEVDGVEDLAKLGARRDARDARVHPHGDGELLVLRGRPLVHRRAQLAQQQHVVGPVVAVHLVVRLAAAGRVLPVDVDAVKVVLGEEVDGGGDERGALVGVGGAAGEELALRPAAEREGEVQVGVPLVAENPERADVPLVRRAPGHAHLGVDDVKVGVRVHRRDGAAARHVEEGVVHVRDLVEVEVAGLEGDAVAVLVDAPAGEVLHHPRRRPAAAAAIGVAALAIAAGRSGGGGGERRGGPKVDEVYLVLRRAAARTGAEV
mmetsp:Transcript_28262/g.92656  ORF Transcript_28262/g.92656 Transcript_28262/m.92656 type:complete len:572 (-) Transcript_28262:422-2137(-)